MQKQVLSSQPNRSNTKQVKEIILTQGKTALVSDDDFERVSKFKWHAAFTLGRWDARRKINLGEKRGIVRMSRFVLGVDCFVDHRDGDSLNNQRNNLRPCTLAQNARNRKNQNHSSKYKGVTLRPELGKWQAGIRANGSRNHLGFFEIEREAAMAYDRAALLHFGEFAKTNQQIGLL